jgi:viologen exporter family transport system permease protein
MAVDTRQLPREPRLRSMVDFYLTAMRTHIQAEFQYRVATYMYLIGMVAEPVIYLVVWTTIADSHGGSVQGITAGQFAAYYIVWTLVRNMNIVFTPYGWEWRIREGHFSGLMLRPLHPIHYDLADFAGGKFIWVLLYLPIAVGLTLIFHPTFDFTPLEIVVFFFAIWGAYLIRSLALWLLGMITFWTTRGSAIFETYMMIELLLSGRLVPLPLMPDWAQSLANWLPFKWTFYFPIEVLVGNLSNASLIGGLGMQALWTAIGGGAVFVCWRATSKHYTAVGN